MSSLIPNSAVPNVSRLPVIGNPTSPTKGYMVGLDANGRMLAKPPLIMQFLYNPNKMEDEKRVDYIPTHLPGLDAPRYSYSNGGDHEISFTLFMNAYEFDAEPTVSLPLPGFGGIASDIAKLQSFTYAKQASILGNIKSNFAGGLGGSFVGVFQTLGGKKPRTSNPLQFTPPPKCLFGFGAVVHECFVRSIRITTTMWNTALDPLRAEASVSLLVDANSNVQTSNDQRRNLLAAIGALNTNPLKSLPIRIPGIK